MNIGIESDRANKLEKTGTEWYAYNIIEELKKIDDKNRYFLFSRSPLKGKLGLLPPNFESKVLKWPPRRLWHLLRLSLELFFHRPDIFFVPAHTIPFYSPPKTITTIHDVGFERFPELYTPLELKYHRYSLRVALKKAVKIIAVSHFTKNEILDLFDINPDKIMVIHNSYREDLFHPHIDEIKKNDILKRYQIREPFLLYVGRLEQKKNTPGLVKAFGLLKERRPDFKNLQLVLIGEPGYKYEEVERNINKFNLFSQVLKLGYLEATELPYILAGAKIFVFPSLYEGFGIPVLEAMATGVPVITANSASLPEIAGEAAQLVDPKNTQEISEAMEKILDDQNLRQEMIKRGFERVKKFSWQKSARGVYSLFETLGGQN